MKHPLHEESFSPSILHRWNPFIKSWQWWDTTEYDGGNCWRMTEKRPRRVYKDQVVSIVDTWCEPTSETFENA